MVARPRLGDWVIVLGLRYHQELRLAEIGEVLGVTESRICQLHAKAVLHVRALLPDDLAPAGV